MVPFLVSQAGAKVRTRNAHLSLAEAHPLGRFLGLLDLEAANFFAGQSLQVV
jgi:hypothetical protein